MAQDNRVAFVQSEVAHRLGKMEALFAEGIKITFIARLPGNDEADFMLTNDDLDEIGKLLARSKARSSVPINGEQ